MKFKKYWRNLSHADKQAFSRACGTSPQNIERKYVNAEQVPRRDRMEKMIALSQPEVSRDEMLEHFYPLSDSRQSL